MALNQEILSDLNPIRMVPVGTPEFPTWRNDWFYNQIKPWEEKTNYYQKWVDGKSIFMQFKANHSPVQAYLLNCSGVQIANIDVQVVSTTYINPQLTTYQIEFTPPIIDGLWYLVLSFGFEDTLTKYVSEPQITVNPLSGLMHIQYWHESNTKDVYFKNGLKFQLFVEALRGQLTPKVKRSIWIDQPYNAKTIDGVNYQEFKFILGDAYGVPEYLGDKLAAIFCMNHVLLNGVEYTQTEGSEWEVVTVEGYPKYGYKTDIQPTKNVGALRGENTNTPAQNFMVTYNIDTTAFGAYNGNVSGQNLQITKVE